MLLTAVPARSAEVVHQHDVGFGGAIYYLFEPTLLI